MLPEPLPPPEPPPEPSAAARTTNGVAATATAEIASSGARARAGSIRSAQRPPTQDPTAMAVSAVITGYYAWHGYGWTPRAGLVAVAVALLALMINPLASWGIAPIAVGAGLLWLPASGAFFARWHARRHPAPVSVPDEPADVYYGPLPRYR